MRNYSELGINLQKICQRLLANDNLVKLLYYTDADPLGQPALTKEKKETLLHDLIQVIPRSSERDDNRSLVIMYVPSATTISGNSEFKNIEIHFQVVVPLVEWVIKDSNLRPFAIMGEIQTSLNGKTINGLGKIIGGDFTLEVVTNEVSIYNQTFRITQYD